MRPLEKNYRAALDAYWRAREAVAVLATDKLTDDLIKAVRELDAAHRRDQACQTTSSRAV
jgi:hypothetical protein